MPPIENDAGVLGENDMVHAARRPAVAWLHLAATPTFMAIAIFNALDHRPMDMLCGEVHGASPFSGMALMYALMGVFHAAPWLQWIARMRSSLRATSALAKIEDHRLSRRTVHKDAANGIDYLPANGRCGPR